MTNGTLITENNADKLMETVKIDDLLKLGASVVES